MSYAIQRATKRAPTASAILEASEGKSRKHMLSKEEEQLILNAALYYQNNGTPLDCPCLMEIAKVIVDTFPVEDQHKIGFKNNRQGKTWIKAF